VCIFSMPTWKDVINGHCVCHKQTGNKIQQPELALSVFNNYSKGKGKGKEYVDLYSASHATGTPNAHLRH